MWKQLDQSLDPASTIQRPPLSPKARRAGWIGCNFALDRVPLDARIAVVKDRTVTPADVVREQFRKVKPLEDFPVEKRGWALEVLTVIRAMNKPVFTNAEIFAFAPHFKKLHPGNDNIEAKIRQKLQVLRDAGFLRSPRRGVWEVLPR